MGPLFWISKIWQRNRNQRSKKNPYRYLVPRKLVKFGLLRPIGSGILNFENLNSEIWKSACTVREVGFLANHNAAKGASQDLFGILLFISNIILRILLNHSFFIYFLIKNSLIAKEKAKKISENIKLSLDGKTSIHQESFDKKKNVQCVNQNVRNWKFFMG